MCGGDLLGLCIVLVIDCAMRTHVLETLAFPRGSYSLCRQPRLLRPVAVFLCATYICKPFCGHFCSVLLSALFCLRPFFLRLGVLLFSVPFSFCDGSPDISNGMRLFFFRCRHRYFGLRCSYPLHRFSDTSPGKGRFQQLPQTWSPLQERGCASPDSKAHAACFTLHTLHLHQPHAFPSNPSTLYRHCVAVSTPRQKISFRPCAYCRHYTIVFVRRSYTHGNFCYLACETNLVVLYGKNKKKNDYKEN